jgi:hypothetical protein
MPASASVETITGRVWRRLGFTSDLCANSILLLKKYKKPIEVGKSPSVRTNKAAKLMCAKVRNLGRPWVENGHHCKRTVVMFPESGEMCIQLATRDGPDL